MKYLLLTSSLLVLLSCNSKPTDSNQSTSSTDLLQTTEKSTPDTEIEIVSGKIDTLIINGTIYELTPISKSSFDEIPTIDFKEPDEETIDDKENVKRNNLKLTFNLLNGADTTLKNDTTESWSDYIDYQYLKSFDFMNYWLISLIYYEGFSYTLLDKENGDQITVWCPPIFSPDKEKFVCNSFDMEAGYNPNGIQYFKIIDEKLKNVWSVDIIDWGPSKIKWANDTTLLIEQKIMTPDAEKFYTTQYKQMILN